MKTILNNKDYAQLCLQCPFPKCVMDWYGQCERTRPYTQERAEEYKTRERNKRKVDTDAD